MFQSWRQPLAPKGPLLDEPSDYAACIRSATEVVMNRNVARDDLANAAEAFLKAEYTRWQNYEPEPEGEGEPT